MIEKNNLIFFKFNFLHKIIVMLNMCISFQSPSLLTKHKHKNNKDIGNVGYFPVLSLITKY